MLLGVKVPDSLALVKIIACETVRLNKQLSGNTHLHALHLQSQERSSIILGHTKDPILIHRQRWVQPSHVRLCLKRFPLGFMNDVYVQISNAQNMAILKLQCLTMYMAKCHVCSQCPDLAIYPQAGLNVELKLFIVFT